MYILSGNWHIYKFVYCCCVFIQVLFLQHINFFLFDSNLFLSFQNLHAMLFSVAVMESVGKRFTSGYWNTSNHELKVTWYQVFFILTHCSLILQSLNFELYGEILQNAKCILFSTDVRFLHQGKASTSPSLSLMDRPSGVYNVHGDMLDIFSCYKFPWFDDT